MHRCGWSSLYAALSRGCIDEEALRELLSSHPLDNDGAKDTPQVYAIDVSAWPRRDAETSPKRGYYHPSRYSAGQPIVAGWAHQLVVGLGFECDSWIAPMDARHVPPEQDTNEVAAEQVRALVSRLLSRDNGGGETPLFVFDAGYDLVRLQRDLEGCPAQTLVRLHSGRTFYADPPTLERRPVGRPLIHGKKFDPKDQKTWHEPSAKHTSEDIAFGEVRVSAWARLHPKTRRVDERYEEPDE